MEVINLKNNRTCTVCESDTFFKQDGYFFCHKCLTQVVDLQDQIVDEAYDPTIKRVKTKIKKRARTKEAEGCTSWELYNFILIGIVDQLIVKFNVDPGIKLTTLQLWVKYLQHLEVAFTSTKEVLIPKFNHGFRKKDARIIYGLGKHKRKRRFANCRGSVTSRSSSNSSIQGNRVISARSKTFKQKQYLAAEYEKEHSDLSELNSDYTDSSVSAGSSVASNTSLNSKASIKLIKFNKVSRQEKKRLKRLIKIHAYPKSVRKDFLSRTVNCSPAFKINILNIDKIYAIIYLALKIHNQKFNVDDLLRFIREGHLAFHRLDTVIPDDVPLVAEDIDILISNMTLRHRLFRKDIFLMTKILGVTYYSEPDIGELIEKYCTELQLPKGIMLYAKRLLALTKPQMKVKDKEPFFEGRAMSFIIVTLKLLLGFDGNTEYEISKLAEDINRIAGERNILDSTLFSFREWQWYIECRREVLSQIHLPTKWNNDPDNQENNHLFYKFFESLQGRIYSDPEYNRRQEIFTTAFKMWFDQMDGNKFDINEPETFLPSFLPFHSYLQQLLHSPNYNLPDILKVNFVETKVGYMTKPQKLKDLAAQCDIELEIVDSNINYIESMLPTFTMLVQNWGVRYGHSTSVEIVDEKSLRRTENLEEYHLKREKIAVKIDKKREQIYDNLKSQQLVKSNDDDFCFDEIEGDGTLSIPPDFSDDEDDHSKVPNEKIMFDHEKESIVKKHPRCVLRRNPNWLIMKRSKLTNRMEFAKHAEEIDNEYDYAFIQEDLRDSDYGDSDSSKENYNQNIENADKPESKNKRQFFRPFGHYWLHAISAENPVNSTFKTNRVYLPHSYLWLLNECAKTIECRVSDLYAEVCFVESYFAVSLKWNHRDYRLYYKNYFGSLKKLW